MDGSTNFSTNTHATEPGIAGPAQAVQPGHVDWWQATYPVVIVAMFQKHCIRTGTHSTSWAVLAYTV